MWERGERHNPISNRHRYYRDYRPFLPQDRTLNWFSKAYTQYPQIYFQFYLPGGAKKIIYSNNIPVKDREKLVNVSRQTEKLRKSLTVLGMLFGIAATKQFVQLKHLYKYKIVPVVFFFGAVYAATRIPFFTYYKSVEPLYNYIYQKYSNVAVDDISKVKDLRRSFFRPDTDVYYRETPHDIKHGHDGGHGDHGHHDSSDYYGPYPLNDNQNVDHVAEVKRKFTTGHSAYDDHELLLGDKIDIKRTVRGIPTGEEYRRI